MLDLIGVEPPREELGIPKEDVKTWDLITWK